MNRRGFVAGLGSLVTVGVIGASRVTAQDRQGCEGLAEYQTDMDDASNEFRNSWRDEFNSRFAETFSSDEWGIYADLFLQLQRDLKAITPPTWAYNWHNNRIGYVGIIEQVGKAVSVSGIFASIVFSDAIERIKTQEVEAVRDAESVCFDFRDWAATWDDNNDFAHQLRDLAPGASPVVATPEP